MVEAGQTCYDAEVAFSRWDPLRDLLSLQDQIGQLVGADAPGWTPAVDLYETADDYVLSAELPGLARDQVEIHAEDNRITIRGERASVPCGASGAVACEQFHRVERGHGPFSRAFVLPEPVLVDGVRAELKDGVLTVTIPKAARHGPRKINVT
jgi:HSP20 family protein